MSVKILVSYTYSFLHNSISCKPCHFHMEAWKWPNCLWKLFLRGSAFNSIYTQLNSLKIYTSIVYDMSQKISQDLDRLDLFYLHFKDGFSSSLEFLIRFTSSYAVLSTLLQTDKFFIHHFLSFHLFSLICWHILTIYKILFVSFLPCLLSIVSIIFFSCLSYFRFFLFTSFVDL